MLDGWQLKVASLLRIILGSKSEKFKKLRLGKN